MGPLKSFLVWLIIVAGFVVLGMFVDDDWMRPPHGLDGPITDVALGIGVASSVVTGLHIIRTARAKRLSRLAGATLLVISSALTILISGFALKMVSALTPNRINGEGFQLFQGEHGWMILGMFGFAFWATIAIFALLAPWVLIRGNFIQK